MRKLPIFVSAMIILGVARTSYAQSNYDYYGTKGRLTISNTSIDVPLYYYLFTEIDEAQKVCDEPNKAVYENVSILYDEEIMPYIGDHNVQGFYELYDVVPNETVAKISHEDGSKETYILREKNREAYNDMRKIYIDGEDIAKRYPSDWILIYTCNPEGQSSVTTTFCEPIKDLN